MIHEGRDEHGPFVLLALKVVPGASRDEIAGPLGEGDDARLKVRTSAPPEGGKANKAVRALIARALGVKPRDVDILTGHTSPEKILRIRGISTQTVGSRLDTRP